MDLETRDYFQYKNLHFHPVIEEYVLWELLKAIHKRKYVKFKYNSPKVIYKETYREDKLEELYERNFKHSWSSVNLSMGKN